MFHGNGVEFAPTVISLRDSQSYFRTDSLESEERIDQLFYNVSVTCSPWKRCLLKLSTILIILKHIWAKTLFHTWLSNLREVTATEGAVSENLMAALNKRTVLEQKAISASPGKPFPLSSPESAGCLAVAAATTSLLQPFPPHYQKLETEFPSSCLA